MKKDCKKSKIVIMLIIALTLVLIVCGIFLLHYLQKPEEVHEHDALHLPDYDENIFFNQAYMSFQRDMIYSVGGVDQLFSYEKDLASCEAECRFFLEYFNSVIHGKYDEIKDFYVDGYFKEKPKFTMQMIYEPYVQFHSATKDEYNGEEIDLYNFQVRYKIMKNNGTFRPDVPSNTEIPQIYQLIKDKEGNYRIFRILEIEVEE